MEACYYVPVTSMISGAIVSSTARYVWHLQAAIRGRMSGRFVVLFFSNPPFSFAIVLVKVFSFSEQHLIIYSLVFLQHFIP